MVIIDVNRFAKRSGMHRSQEGSKLYRCDSSVKAPARISALIYRLFIINEYLFYLVDFAGLRLPFQ